MLMSFPTDGLVQQTETPVFPCAIPRRIAAVSQQYILPVMNRNYSLNLVVMCISGKPQTRDAQDRRMGRSAVLFQSVTGIRE